MITLVPAVLDAIMGLLIALASPAHTSVHPHLAVAFPDSSVRAYEEEIRLWHERRIASLKRDHGWLTLIALDWLNEGSNEIASTGTVTLENGKVSFYVSPGVQATLAGKPFTSGPVKTDAEVGGPEKIELGSRAFIIIKRGSQYAVRVWDSNALARKKFTGIERFPVSTAWRIDARWEPFNPAKQIKVPSVVPSYEEDYSVPGVAVFTIAGAEYRLEPVLEEGATDLFFIFGDKTNGKDTYGGGRFLYAKPPKDGKVVLDFNKAYNPPCAFSPYATCPLPPASNRLPVRIDAGEKKYKDH